MKFTTSCEVKSITTNMFLSLFLLFFFLRASEKTWSQDKSLKFQRKQSSYALIWTLQKQTTNGNHDCTDRHSWQDLSCSICFAFLKIMQMCGESVGVKVKCSFVLELLLECSATQEKTIVDQLVICLFSRIITALHFNFKSFHMVLLCVKSRQNGPKFPLLVSVQLFYSSCSAHTLTI